MGGGDLGIVDDGRVPDRGAARHDVELGVSVSVLGFVFFVLGLSVAGGCLGLGKRPRDTPDLGKHVGGSVVHDRY